MNGAPEEPDGQIPLALDYQDMARSGAGRPAHADARHISRHTARYRSRRIFPTASGFGGYSWGEIAGALALIALVVWSAWLTRETLALRERRIVAVSLSALVNDFIMAEARSGNPPALVESETRHFMALLDAALAARAARGETIIVGEAVVAGSVPSITAEVRAELGRAITARAPGSPGSAAQGARPPRTHEDGGTQ